MANWPRELVDALVAESVCAQFKNWDLPTAIRVVREAPQKHLEGRRVKVIASLDVAHAALPAELAELEVMYGMTASAPG